MITTLGAWKVRLQDESMAPFFPQTLKPSVSSLALSPKALQTQRLKHVKPLHPKPFIPEALNPKPYSERKAMNREYAASFRRILFTI